MRIWAVASSVRSFVVEADWQAWKEAHPDGFGAVFFEVRDAGLDLIFAEIAGFCDFEDIGFSPAWDMMVWKDETAKVAWCHDRGL